ncbi:hypothetical protein [Nostoc sp. C117]
MYYKLWRKTSDYTSVAMCRCVAACLSIIKVVNKFHTGELGSDRL